jgi:hypothetical protein
MPRPLRTNPPTAKTVKTTLVLPAELWDQLKAVAFMQQKDFRTVAIEALTQYVTPQKAAIRHMLEAAGRGAKKGGTR